MTQRPTLPFDEGEMKRILAAADKLATWASFGPKARAMVLMLRYSGLRMQDAACLERKRLSDGRLFLYTQKTDTPVYCPLPPEVVIALKAVPNDHPDYVFWDRSRDRLAGLERSIVVRIYSMKAKPIVGRGRQGRPRSVP